MDPKVKVQMIPPVPTEMRVENRSHVKHEREWTQRFRDWNFSRVELFAVGELVPAPSTCIGIIERSDDVVASRLYAFLIPVPKPRNILSLDKAVKDRFETWELREEFWRAHWDCDNTLEDVLDNRILPMVKAHLYSVFRSPEEESWYYSKRTLSVALDGLALILTIRNKED